MKKLLLLLSAITLTLSSCFFKTSEIDNSLLPVKSGEKWGYVNKKGVFVINPQYKDADFFREGIAQVKYSDGKIGYIDKKGKQVIAAKYSQGTHFFEEKAFVVTPGGFPECIDEKGNVVITPQYDGANSFSEGLAVVRQNDKWGYIDKKGVMVIPFQFAGAFDFKEGLALFYNGNDYGFIDKKGTYIITPQYDDRTCDFSEGLALIHQGDMCGFIDKKGKVVINPQFEGAFSFSNKLAIFTLNHKWGFIDKSAKQIIPAQFENASDFFGDVAWVKLGDKWGLIDKNAKYLISPQYDDTKRDIATANGSGVSSEYYDATEQVNQFLKLCELTSSSFDGFSANTTLQDIINHRIHGDNAQCYGDGLNADDDNNKVVSIFDHHAFKAMDKYWEELLEADDEDNLFITSGAAILNQIGNNMFYFPMAVSFKNPICSREDYYSPKEFALDETISSVLYLIVPLHGYSEKEIEISVMKELEKQISQKVPLSFKTLHKGEYGTDLDAAFSEKLNIALSFEDEELILMLVGFDSYSQDVIKKWGRNMDEFYDKFDKIFDKIFD